MDSVLSQTFRDIEYIIVDGKSTDHTLSLVQKYQDDSRVEIISEPDKGIYDAMNKGVKRAHGEYVEFLNSGDSFVDKNVLQKVYEFISSSTEELFYGDIVYQQPDGTECIRKYSRFCSSNFYYLLGDSINHQSLFAKRECFDGQPFDLQYRIVADRDWLIRMKKQKKSYRYMDILVCNYSLDSESFSIVNRDAHWKEVDTCIRKYYIMGFPLYYLINAIRHGRYTSQILHFLYKIVFIKSIRR